MSNLRQETIYGNWKHSFEEDDEQHMVYRPGGFEFQRSRGRKELEIREDGKFVGTGHGPTDVMRSFEGLWHLDGDCLVVEYNDGHKAQFNIEDASKDKLVLKK